MSFVSNARPRLISLLQLAATAAALSLSTIATVWADGESPGDNAQALACRQAVRPAEVFERQLGELQTVRESGNRGFFLAPRTYPDGARVEPGLSQLDGAYLIARGASMDGTITREFQREIDQVLREAGVPAGMITIRVHTTPVTVGERVRDILPKADDFEAPVVSEIREGMVGTLGVEASTVTYVANSFPALTAVRMLVGHFALLTAVTAFRRTLGNWTARTVFPDQPRLARLEGLLKQTLVSALFTINYSVNLGSVNSVGQQSFTTLLQGVFFYSMFPRAIWAWERSQALRGGDASERARRTGSILGPVIFFTTAPLLAVASNPEATRLVEAGGLYFNTGHLGLSIAALLGIGLSQRQELLTALSGRMDRVYSTLAAAQGKLRQLALGIRERLFGPAAPREPGPVLGTRGNSAGYRIGGQDLGDLTVLRSQIQALVQELNAASGGAEPAPSPSQP